jgi:hypothetical protein
MARFLYDNPKTGQTVEHVCPCGEAPQTITLEDGTVCERNLGAEIAGRGPDTPSCWPMTSRALAVHPTQRQQYEEFSRTHGVPTEFDRQGHPIFESRAHRKRYAELVGAIDYEGTYGDPQG